MIRLEMMKHIRVGDQVTQKTLTDQDFLLRNHYFAILDIQRSLGEIARRLEERITNHFSVKAQTNSVAQLNVIYTRSGRVLGP